mmetsp:Transcript_1718/g.2370  ORF Transcript_1718/g.2370 Transcript_1718/m.2370 type:complete len:223 (-) Transcript_1718:147-815(-)
MPPNVNTNIMAFGSYSLEPQSTVPHLLSTGTPSMSCSSEAVNTLLISPPCIQTFEWSDFPIVCRSVDDHLFKAPVNEPPTGILDTVNTRTTKVATRRTDARRTTKKKVSFSNLEIREYSVVFGDHPSCENLPLSLGWGHSEDEIIDLNAWEHSRAGYRRHGYELKLSFFERKNILKRVGGMSESDLVELERERRCGGKVCVSSPLHHVPTTRTLAQWTENTC